MDGPLLSSPPRPRPRGDHKCLLLFYCGSEGAVEAMGKWQQTPHILGAGKSSKLASDSATGGGTLPRINWFVSVIVVACFAF